MFKQFKRILIVCWFSFISLQASLQIAIPAGDFCAGNSLVLIARDGNGFEQVAGCVSFADGKTQFSYDEISRHNQTISSIAEQKAAIIADFYENQAKLEDASIVYLYFEVDPNSIVRVLMIKNNFLADNPYDVVEFSTASCLLDDEDDFFGNQGDDELSSFNLEDLKGTESVELSHYDTIVLGTYALWAVQSAAAQKSYKNFTTWIASYYA